MSTAELLQSIFTALKTFQDHPELLDVQGPDKLDPNGVLQDVDDTLWGLIWNLTDD